LAKNGLGFRKYEKNYHKNLLQPLNLEVATEKTRDSRLQSSPLKLDEKLHVKSKCPYNIRYIDLKLFDMT